MKVLHSVVHAVAAIAVSTVLNTPANAACLDPVGAIPDGPTLAVDVDGTLGAFGRGRRLVLLDLTDTAEPVELGSVVLPGIVASVQLDGRLAWVAAGAGGLVAVDVSDPQIPAIVGVHPAGLDGEPAEVTDAVVVDELAYLIATRWVDDEWEGGLRVVDVSSPAAPELVSEHLWQRLRFDGTVVVTEGVALIVDHGMVRMVNVSQPDRPRYVGGFGALWGVQSVAAAGETAYVATTRELLVVDLSLPDDDPVSELDTGRRPGPLALDGDVGYLGTSGPGVSVVDLSDPQLPSELAFVETSAPIVDLAVDGGRALLAAADAGARVADVSNPADPRITSSIDGVGPWDSIVADGELAVVVRPDAVVLVELSEPGSPTEAASLPIPFDWDSPYAPPLRPALDGSTAYVPWSTGLGVFDVSDPSSPGLIAELEADFPLDLAATGSHLYMLGYAHGALTVVDVTNPGSPWIAGEVGVGQGESAYRIAVDGDRAAVATTPCNPGIPCSRTVETFDVSSPAQPIHLDAVHQEADAVLVHDGFIFAAGYDGVTIFDARDPAGLVEVATVTGDPFGNPTLALHEEILSVSAVQYPFEGGLIHVIDVSDPLRPRLIGEHATPGGARDLAVADGHLLVADGDGGLLVLEPTSCLAPPPRRGGGRR